MIAVLWVGGVIAYIIIGGIMYKSLEMTGAYEYYHGLAELGGCCWPLTAVILLFWATVKLGCKIPELVVNRWKKHG